MEERWTKGEGSLLQGTSGNFWLSQLGREVLLASSGQKLGCYYTSYNSQFTGHPPTTKNYQAQNKQDKKETLPWLRDLRFVPCADDPMNKWLQSDVKYQIPPSPTQTWLLMSNNPFQNSLNRGTICKNWKWERSYLQSFITTDYLQPSRLLVLSEIASSKLKDNHQKEFEH